MNPYSVTPRKRRGVIIVSVCLLLLAGFGLAYFIYQRNNKTVQRLGIAQGNVVQVVGNTIILREVGKDFADPADDVPRTLAITKDTQVKVTIADGTLVLADASALRTVGAYVAIQSSKINASGIEEIQAANVFYVPSSTMEQ